MHREGVRGVVGVAMATPTFQYLFHKIVLECPKCLKSQKSRSLKA